MPTNQAQKSLDVTKISTGTLAYGTFRRGRTIPDESRRLYRRDLLQRARVRMRNFEKLGDVLIVLVLVVVVHDALSDTRDTEIALEQQFAIIKLPL